MQCESCLVVEGGAQFHEVLAEYRGHMLCFWCTIEWERREERLGRVVTFGEFTGNTKYVPLTPERRMKRNKSIRLQTDKTNEELSRLYKISIRSILRIKRG